MFDRTEMKELQLKAEEWKRKVESALSKRPERKDKFETISGTPAKRLYTPLDIGELDYVRDLSFSGEYPFTRGVQPTMYRGRFWTMRQYAGFGSAEDTNKRYRYLLEQGQTGLSVAFDLPTQIGYDSDHPLAKAEVGKVGVAIDSIRDMETLFDQIPLDKVSTSMTINSPASILTAMYIAVAEAQGVPASQLRGTIQNDILKEYAARGTYIFPPKPSMRLVTDVLEFCSKHVPRWNSISVSGYHMREAGCTAVQEVAFTLANAIAYVDAGIKAGLGVDDFAGRLSFFFDAHLDFLEEIAKFRAARRLWARVMRQRFRAKKPRSWMLRFHTQTAGCSLTAQQPYNNIVRTAFEALAAVFGGTQSLHTNAMDEALALPSQEAVQVALRTQQLIAFETGVTETIDPLGGSYYIENLTSRIEHEAQAYIDKIDELGGAPAAIEQGFIQREIQKSAYGYQKATESGEQVVIGVNKFAVEEPLPIDLLKVNPAVRGRQVEKLAKLKSERANSKLESALSGIKKAAEGQSNLMPPIYEAVKSYATVGEICDALREVFGEYEAPVTI